MYSLQSVPLEKYMIHVDCYLNLGKNIIYCHETTYLLLNSTVGAVAEAFLPSLNSLMKTSLRMMSLASLKMVEKITVTLSALASTYMVSSSL